MFQVSMQISTAYVTQLPMYPKKINCEKLTLK